MNIHALYHRPKSEYCYAYAQDDVRVTLRSAKGDVERVTLFYADPYRLHVKSHKEMELRFSDDLFEYYTASMAMASNRICYYFLIQGGGQEVILNQIGLMEKEQGERMGANPQAQVAFTYNYVNEADIHETPEWVRDSVFYQIFPDSFRNGNPYNDPEGTVPWGTKTTEHSVKGGDLDGIIEKLEYLEELGIDCIYMTPIFHGGSNHKYDTIDYFEIDPAFGTKETLRKLVGKAHEKGIKVVLDAVFNHSGHRFPRFQDVVKQGRESKYVDWFYIHTFPLPEPDDLVKKQDEYVAEKGVYWDWEIDPQTGKSIIPYRTFANAPQMPKLRTSNPEVREYLLRVAEYWITECDIDGWRLDVAPEVDHAFWREFRKVVKAAKPDAYIVGEIWREAQAWLQGDQYDAVMNYLVGEACKLYFAKAEISAQQFKEQISGNLMTYSWQVNEVMMNLLDSHDTERFIHNTDSYDKVLLAFGFVFGFVGAPFIYYGTEIGMEGGPNPDNRRCMIWDEEKWNTEILEKMKALIKVRKDHIALRRGEFAWRHEYEDMVVFERQHDEENVLVFLNNSAAPRTVELPDAYSGGTELFSNSTLDRTLSIAPYGYAYVRQ